MVVVLVPVDGTAAAVQFTLQVAVLAGGQMAVVKPAVQMLLSMNERIAMVEAVLFAPRELPALDALMDASMLVAEALVKCLCLGGHRDKGCAQQGRRDKNWSLY